MRIIDAHLHIFENSEYTETKNSFAGKLTGLYENLEIKAGIVMGNQALLPESYNFPPAFRYCIGVGTFERMVKPSAEILLAAEEHLKRKACVGIKIYTGYTPIYAFDERLKPFYALADKYDKPVAFHTGMTAGSMGLLKYSHPLAVDEAAAAFPNVRFVLCHFGNPFLAEAAAVMEKNSNVSADLSGLLDGKTDLDRYFDRHLGYVQLLRTWMRYVDDDSRFMFGTDYPAVDIENYVEFISRLVDKESMEKIFFENANRIHGLGL